MTEDRLDQLFQYLDQDQNDPFLYYAIATEYTRRGELEKALDFFQQTRRRFPAYVGTYYHLGKLLEKLGRKEEAIDVYREGTDCANDAREMNAVRELKEALAQAIGGGGEEW